MLYCSWKSSTPTGRIIISTNHGFLIQGKTESFNDLVDCKWVTLTTAGTLKGAVDEARERHGFVKNVMFRVIDKSTGRVVFDKGVKKN